MSITIEEKGSFEINIGPSDTEKGRINVTIFAPDQRGMFEAFMKLRRDYHVVKITTPIRSAKGVWCSRGKVWNV